MKSLWKDRTSLKRKIVQSRKQHFLDSLLNNTLSIEESAEIIEKVIHCNKILFELKMYEKNEKLVEDE